MKKVKNYIPVDLAKKKIARYKYWNIKDEMGISMTDSEEASSGQSFADFIDKLLVDNVDAEVQVKYGTNEQSSRQNAPIFIKINENIEWIEPEQDDESVKINGVPHKLDKNGNVNINLNSPQPEPPTIEPTHDFMRQEMEIQLEGIRKESELKEQRFNAEMHNKLAEQTIKFKEMMLNDRETRIAEREQTLLQQEAILEEKQNEMSDQLKGYVKLIPSTLGSVISEWVKDNPFKKSTGLGTAKTKEKPKPIRNTVQFSIAHNDEAIPEPEEEPQTIEPDFDTDILDIEVNEIEHVAPEEPEIEEQEENITDNEKL